MFWGKRKSDKAMLTSALPVIALSVMYFFSQDFQSLENSDSEAASWPQDQEDTPDLIPNYDIYEENQAQT